MKLGAKTFLGLIILGLMLISIGALEVTGILPLVTLVIDDTPPNFIDTVPSNGETYSSLGTLVAKVDDPESGVRSVICTLLGKTYTLKQVTGGWSYALPYDVIEMLKMMKNQWIDFSFTATNYVGLSKTISGKFMIYEAISGIWYINGQKITSPTQTVYSTSRTISFKFQKTAGNPVKVWVEEGGVSILTLSQTSTGVWEGTKTFTPGTHTLKLRASDNVMTYTLMAVDVGIPGGQLTFDSRTITGLIFMAMGVGLLVIGVKGMRSK